MLALLQPARTTTPVHDAALLAARVGLGVILLAHGWQKYNEYTLGGTADAFGEMGVPAATAAALFATVAEILGGLALIAGLLTRVFAALNIVSLAGALIIVHAGNGVFVETGGFELVLALIAGLVLFLTFGPGRFSVDQLISRRSSTT